jgi:hypothetical protein
VVVDVVMAVVVVVAVRTLITPAATTLRLSRDWGCWCGLPRNPGQR